jgi:ABC-type dipeptide/oligopeptide/nickel transport system permease component
VRAYIVSRLGYGLISLFLLSLTIFVVMRALGGDPAMMIVGPGSRPEDLERVRQEWGLKEPLPVQYVTWLTNCLRGDFGTSFQYRVPVRDLYFQRLPNSLQLAFAAFIVSLVIGVPLGIVTAVRVNTIWDSVSKVIALLGLSVPGFFVGLLGIIIFAVGLHLLPPAYNGTWQALVMPAIALGWYFAASLLRLTRSSMLDVLDSEYVKLARLKGLPGRIVIVKHAFKNALIPVVTLAGINFALLVNGGVIIETIFAWPGIGRLLFEGIGFRDFPIVQGVVMMAGLMIIGVNLLIDLLYALIDPRIRYT